jgi:hypothetical protein
MKRTWITVKRGILEPKHRFALGELIWLFIYILDLTNWEAGVIEEWLDRGAAEEMEMPIATLRDQRMKLEKLGYITSERKQHGIRILVHNWTNPREYTGKKYNEKLPVNTLDITPSHTPVNTLDIKSTPIDSVPSYNQKSQIKNQNILPNGKPEPEYEPFNNQADMPQSFVDEYQPKKIKKEKHQPDPRYTHPAYQLFYAITSRRPNKELVDQIIDILGDHPEGERAKKCQVEWIARGYNPNSIKWLDWYVSGIPGQKKNIQSKNDEILQRFMERANGNG